MFIKESETYSQANMDISKGRGINQLKLKTVAQEPNDDESFELLSKIINGALGGSLGLITLFPLDTVKTRLQSQPTPIYRNWFHALGMITRQEGFKGLYKGLGVTVALVTPELTAKLVTYDYMLHHLKSLTDGDLTIGHQTFAAAVAGFVQIHITTPSELIKVQLQTQKFASSKHTRDVFRTLFQDEGILGLFRGYVVTTLRDVNFAMIYFPLYTYLIDYGPPSKKDLDRPADWVAFSGGFVAALTAAFAVTPFDVIKTRMQSDVHASDGILDCFRKIVSCRGWKGLFSGVTCRALLIAPLLGICQMVYSFEAAEKLKIFLEQSDEGTDI